MQDQKPDLLARLRDVPHQPGVYVMRDRLHRVIYVGKAKDLRKRLSNYFQPSQHKRHDIKTRALVESIWDFEVHTVRNEPESLILEGNQIWLAQQQQSEFLVALDRNQGDIRALVTDVQGLTTGLRDRIAARS